MKGAKKMVRKSIKTACLVLALAFAGTSAVWADARVDALYQSLQRRAEGREKAASLRARLDAEIAHEPLMKLWRRCTGRDESVRLNAAWSILRGVVPGGDVSRWAEVNYLELPSETPRAFMVIDALYTALLELPRIEGGEWLAAELLREFSKSPHGRYDFLGVCPAPVAQALDDIVSRTGLIGVWKPREVVGSLPIARQVRGAVSDSYAIGEGMQFLDGAALPASNGIYAWDRPTGRIYRVFVRIDHHH